MKNSSAVQKDVSYAYPSSLNARHFGFPKGCYVVSVGDKELAAFATESEAVAYADKLPQPYSRWSLNIYNR